MPIETIQLIGWLAVIAVAVIFLIVAFYPHSKPVEKTDIRDVPDFINFANGNPKAVAGQRYTGGGGGYTTRTPKHSSSRRNDVDDSFVPYMGYPGPIDFAAPNDNYGYSGHDSGSGDGGSSSSGDSGSSGGGDGGGGGGD